MVELKPIKPYSTNYQEVVDDEQNSGANNIIPEIQKVDVNLNKYDKIIIGTPTWWGIAAWPVNTFVKENNFDGKTVIPFCTSASSSLGESGKLLQKEAASENWQSGNRFSSSATDADIKTFTDSIK